MPSWLIGMDGFLITSKAFKSSFDALIFLPRWPSPAAAFAEVAAKDMINVVAILCVHTCMHKEVSALPAAVMDGLKS